MMGNQRLKGAGALALMGLSLLCMPACGPTDQGPAFSTETGNPPSIDGTRVALVIEGSMARIVAQAFAVAPLPATVFVTDAVTRETTRVVVDSDGSFAVELNTGAGVYEVRVLPGTPAALPTDAPAAALVVSRSEAGTFFADPDAQCSTYTDQARDLLVELATSFEGRCDSNEDCVLIDPFAACEDTCPFYSISTSGAADFLASSEALAPSICPGFVDGACQLDEMACIQSVAVCVAGRCLSDLDPDSPQCRCSEDNIEWTHYGAESGVLETRRYGGCFEYNGFIYTDTYGTRCPAVLPGRCNGQDAPLSTDDFVEALEHPDVATVVEDGGLTLPVMAPDEALTVTIGLVQGGQVELTMPFDCAGSETCDLAPGVQALVDLLLRAETDGPSCACASPANAAPGQDLPLCDCDINVATPTCASTVGPNGERIYTDAMECIEGNWEVTSSCPPVAVP